MKKIPLILLFTILNSQFSIPCPAQPGSVGDAAMFHHAPASSAAAFTPSQVTGAALYLSYLDMPVDGNRYNWTNKISSSIVFTNRSSTVLTNTASGIYFPGTAGNYFQMTNSGIPTTNTLHSIWICMKPIAANHTEDCVLGYTATSGRGIYLRSGYYWLMGGDYTTFTTAFSPLTSQYDVAIAAGSPANVSTNGVFCQTSSQLITAGFTLWGIGQDADTDNNYNGYIKFILVCTNYTFTTNDIANLHTYAAGH